LEETSLKKKNKKEFEKIELEIKANLLREKERYLN